MNLQSNGVFTLAARHLAAMMITLADTFVLSPVGSMQNATSYSKSHASLSCCSITASGTSTTTSYSSSDS